MNKSVWANDEAVPVGEVAEEGNEETRDTEIEEESMGEEEEEEIEEEASGRCSVYKFWQLKIMQINNWSLENQIEFYFECLISVCVIASYQSD